MLVSGCLVGSALFTSGCDFPLDPPVWTTEWSFDLIREDRSVADLLPPGIHVAEEGFRIDPVRSSAELRLEDVCETCTCFSGPVPALDIGPLDWAVPAPGGLSAAHLTDGVATLTLKNGTGFDLLRDPTGIFGSLLVELVDTRSDQVLDSTRIVRSFPAGDSLPVSFALNGLELQQNLVARVRARVPGSGCDAVGLADGPRIGADVDVSNARAGSVFVLLSDHAVRAPSRTVDMPDWLRDRIRDGDTRITLHVEAESALSTEIEVELSVARSAEALFGPASALVTPFRIAPGDPDTPVSSRRPFVVDVGRLLDAEEIAFGARTRILGSRRVRLRGPESLRYRVELRAEVPSR